MQATYRINNELDPIWLVYGMILPLEASGRLRFFSTHVIPTDGTDWAWRIHKKAPSCIRFVFIIMFYKLLTCGGHWPEPSLLKTLPVDWDAIEIQTISYFGKRNLSSVVPNLCIPLVVPHVSGAHRRPTGYSNPQHGWPSDTYVNETSKQELTFTGEIRQKLQRFAWLSSGITNQGKVI
jgi:hypothetical protein